MFLEVSLKIERVKIRRKEVNVHHTITFLEISVNVVN